MISKLALEQNKITLISSFPPDKGISPYTVGLVQAIEKVRPIRIVTFKHMYPGFLHPDKSSQHEYESPILCNTTVDRIISWYDPFSWVNAGLSITTKIVHIQWWSPALAVPLCVIALIAKYRKRFVIVTLHNIHPHESYFFLRWLNSWILSVANEFVVHTESQALKLSRITNKRIHVIPHGIITTHRRDITQSEARKELGILPHKKVLLFFGIIRSYKGLDTLIDSFCELSNDSEDFTLIIAGKSWIDDQTLMKNVPDSIRNRIIFHNRFIPDEAVQSYFAAADICILPYKSFDAASGIISLAIYHKTPYILSNLEAFATYQLDSKLSFLAGNSRDLTAAIIFYYGQRENFRTQLKHKLSSMKKEYDWSVISSKLEVIYIETEK